MASQALTRPSTRSGYAEPSNISRVPYLPGLDGMRALAVVAVMIYHANSEWLPGGFLGVEVFFVISGYLITLLLIAEKERTGRVHLGHFWLRRARRLLPALFVMLFLLISYTTIFRSDALGKLRGDVLGGVFYVSNWYQIWVGAGYSSTGDFAPLRHLWSLAVEEQFYLVWPLVMVVLLRVGTRRVFDVAKWLVVAALVITVALALLYRQGRVGECNVTPGAYWTIADRCISKADTLYLSTITRAGGLLFGSAFAMVWRPYAVMRGPLRDKGRLMDLLAIVGLGALGAQTWYVHFITPDGPDPWLFRGGFLITSIASLLVIGAATHRRSFAGPVLGNPLFLWVGTRSYGMYLYHWPIYQVIRRIAGNTLTWPQFAAAMVATVIITEASYRYVETPIRKGVVGIWWRSLRRARDPVPRQLVTVAFSSCLVLSIFGVFSLARADLKQNEIAESTDLGEDVVVDLGNTLGSTGTTTGTQAPTGTTVPAVTAVPGSVAPVQTTTTTSTTTTSTLPAEPIPYLAIGDSVMLGAAGALTERGMTVDAAVSRQMIDVIPLFEQLRDRQLFGRAVVVHLGTNGSFSQNTLDTFLSTMNGVPNVIIMTVKADRSWTAENNTMLRAADVENDNKILLDWEVLSAECPGQCFYGDGIHLRPEGQTYYANLISDLLGI
ncbi:MAG TPA: acyltransferase family protein [Ilumatobacteraceae bacterium]|nr:acyltransferase family protein [Ilumatobacteraceae bacterium]